MAIYRDLEPIILRSKAQSKKFSANAQNRLTKRLGWFELLHALIEQYEERRIPPSQPVRSSECDGLLSDGPFTVSFLTTQPNQGNDD